MSLPSFFKRRVTFFAAALVALAMLFALPPLLLPFLERCGGVVRFEGGTPIFAAPRLGSPLLGAVPEGGAELSVGETEFFPHEANNFGRPLYPLIESFRFFKIEGASEAAWISPDLTMKARDVIGPRFTSQRRFLPLFICAAAGLLATLLLCRKAWRVGGWTAPSLGFAFFAVAFLRQALFSGYLLCSDSMTARVIDGNGYFKIAVDISKGALSGDGWLYTAGYPLLLAPLAALLQPAGVYSFYDAAALLNSMLLSPLIGGFLFAIVWRISGSAFKGACAVFLLTLMPYIHYPFEYWWRPECFRGLILPPCFDISSWQPMYTFLWTGHDIMSDTPAAFFVVLCVWLCLFLRPGLRSTALVSAVFGFACLIRMNDMLYAPLIAFLLLHLNKEALSSGAGLFKTSLAAVLPFSAVFSLQLIENVLQYGSPFTTPYVVHQIASKGFSLSMLPKGPEYLLQTNLVFVCMGLAGTLFQADAFKRVLFSLWAFPAVIFFCGYSGVANSAIRFILPAYGALIGAFVCSDVWSLDRRRLLALAAAILLANFLLVAPPFKYLAADFTLQPLMIQSAWTRAVLTASVVAASLALTVFAFRREMRLFMFVGVFLALYYAGAGMLLFAVMAALFVWALWGGCSDAVRLCLLPAWRDAVTSTYLARS